MRSCGGSVDRGLPVFRISGLIVGCGHDVRDLKHGHGEAVEHVLDLSQRDTQRLR